LIDAVRAADLRRSYRLLAPFYDIAVRAALSRARTRSLARLHRHARADVLVAGIGTGLDLPLLPSVHRYVGVDLTRAMLARAVARRGPLELCFVEGDVQALPFADAGFDAAVLHLILAVVPRPAHCLSEVARVLRPGGRVLLFDKFLRPGERAWLRRALNPVARRVATRTDVVFEDVLAEVPGLTLIADEPALAGGWFRLIELEKKLV
jgi:phosphatidylethanolamine/phosphatidyl-N-methylethanolamine N-methyltransferase